jgi:enoyl-CoA hydratase
MIPGMPYILYDVEDRVAKITLNRPDKANAQNHAFLEELHAAWVRAAEDDDVRVIVLRAEGRHFSAGHDLSQNRDDIPFKVDSEVGIRTHYAYEDTVFLGYAKYWRNVPKPSIAAVHGATVAAGLILLWPCDIIIASEDARFGDAVMKLNMGPGIEYGAHAWELGIRKAKEFLFTGGFIDAQEAHRLGMVNRVVALENLDEETMALAREIAEMDPFALRMAKRSVNMVQDIRGYTNSLDVIQDMHMVNHAHNAALVKHGVSITSDGKELSSVQEIAARNRAALASSAAADDK